VETAGLGNGHDLVGRFFMEHILYRCSTIVPFDEGALYKMYGSLIPFSQREGLHLPYRIRAHIALPERVVRREQILDFRAEITIGTGLGRRDAVFSSNKLYDDLKQMEWPSDFQYHLANIGDDPASVLAWITRAEATGYFYVLWNNVEQAPNPNSRVRLAEGRDILGVPPAAIEWRLTDLDKYSIRRAHELIAAEVGRAGFGRFRIELEDDEEVPLRDATGCCHHMGTTRMHNDPRLGVVDANSKVHGLANLYIAGSSVYPTTGFVSPTLTITALALRLADHLKDRLASLPHEARPAEARP
jgi:choline dehydrogenase-like flavoprotein